MLAPYIMDLQLDRINFSYPSLVTNKGLKALEEKIDVRKLKSIDLSNNAIKAEGLTSLISLFPMPLLEELNLNNTGIMFTEDEADEVGIDPTENFSVFLQELAKCPKLKYLNLNSKNAFPPEMVRLLADALPWLKMNTLVFDNGLTSKEEAIKTLQFLEVGLRWNLTITQFEMPFWLRLANTKNDTCQRINRYLLRNGLYQNNAELFPIREQLSFIKLMNNCANIVLDYLYEDDVIINTLNNFRLPRMRNWKKISDKDTYEAQIEADFFSYDMEAYKPYEYEEYLLELFKQYGVTDVKVYFIPATPIPNIIITIARPEILKLSQYIPESFLAFINSKFACTWIETNEFHLFELDESYTKIQDALEVKQKLESSLRKHLIEIEEIFYVQEKEGILTVNMRITPGEAISIANGPKEVNEELSLAHYFIQKIKTEADPKLPGSAIFSDPKIQLLIAKAYETKGNNQKATVWYQAASKLLTDKQSNPLQLSIKESVFIPFCPDHKYLAKQSYVEIAESKKKKFQDELGHLKKDDAEDPQIGKIQSQVPTLLPEPISLNSDFASLNKFFTNYFESIAVHQKGKLTSVIERKLVYTLTHLAVFNFYIQDHEDYLPINEINLLFHIFSEKNFEKSLLGYYVILFKYLDFLFNILKIRATSKKEKSNHTIDFNKMQEIMHRSEIILFLEKETKKFKEVSKLIMSLFFSLEATFKIPFSNSSKSYFFHYKKSSDSILNQLTTVNEFFLKTYQRQPLENYLIEEKIIYKLIDLNHVLSVFNPNEEKDISNLTELLQNKVTNKKEFAILFIKQFIELYYSFKHEQKHSGLIYLRITFPKLLKILLNEIVLLDEYLEIVSYCNFPFSHEDKDSLPFSYFIDFLKFKLVADWSVLFTFIKDAVKDLSVLEPLFRVWLEGSDRFLLKLSGKKPKDYPLNLFLQFQVEKKYYNSFLKFIQKFYKVNIESISHKKIDSILFFTYTDTDLILYLLNVLGKNFIQSMESDINKSILPLEKKLDRLSIIKNHFIKKLLDHLISFQKPSIPQIYDIQKCLLLFDTLAELKNDKKAYQFDEYKQYREYTQQKADISLNEFLSENKNVNSIKTFLHNICKSILFLVGKNDYQIEDYHIENALKNKKEQWVKIIKAAASVKGNQTMQAIYYNLLSLDLLGKGISHFLRDTNQTHPTGKKLAGHNLSIRNELEKNDINFDNALQYPKSHDFIICSKLEKLYLELGYYLNILSNIIKGLDKMLVSKNFRLKKLQPNLDLVLFNINKAKPKNHEAKHSHIIIEILSKEKDRLRKIAGYCEGITNENPKNLPDKFYQLAHAVNAVISSIQENQVAESKNHLTTEHEQHKATERTTFQTFTIKMLSKDEVSILLLGDEGLGPCMASDTSGFVEILLYRIDDAILIPIVIDKSSNRPVALMWSYFAMKKDGKIGLVLDFFEVNYKFDADVHLYTRTIILNELLYFTHQYLRDNPKIEGFYMNKLTYFWNKWNGHLDKYPLVNISFQDKVGGSFLAENKFLGRTQTETWKIYHLDSLRESFFHQFDSKILMNERNKDSKEVISINDLIDKEVHKLMETKVEVSSSQVSEQLIFKNFYILEHFFEKPFENEKLLKLISEKYQEITSIMSLSKSHFISSSPPPNSQSAATLLKERLSDISCTLNVPYRNFFEV